MGSLVAQNGLKYIVNLVFLIPMTTDEFKKFKYLFQNLVSYVEKINDEGIVIHLTLNINQEISKFGKFKDVPSKTDIINYKPLINNSETFLKSDIYFLYKTMDLYSQKEAFKGIKKSPIISELKEKIKVSMDSPYIQIRNLIVNP